MEPWKTMTIRMPISLLDDLRRVADENHRSMNKQILAYAEKMVDEASETKKQPA
ncbi:hypothetical protein AGMMS49992_29350 [Clostridia bacterium]|nr:hypothetical protein AGMMS49992_29350 [Clostridia bacterium]